MWIFGSRVRGDHRADSDLDISIQLDLTSANGMD
ncbi:nucleotidyltransferase domain-containing protein [uncultured Marinobacter sp.]